LAVPKSESSLGQSFLEVALVQDMYRFEVVQDMSRSEVVQDMCRFGRVHCSQAWSHIPCYLHNLRRTLLAA
jgi:hypothetical protein